MFKTAVHQTLLTSDTANRFFRNICGDHFQSDVSFLATLRALVAPRISEEDSITLCFTSSNYRADQLNGVPVKECVRSITRNMDLESSGRFYVHSFRSSQEDNVASMTAVEAAFSDVYPGFCRLEKITAFFKKSFPVACYVNPEHKNVVIFVDGLDIRRLHYLQMAILPVLPWYFSPDAGISEDEMELIQSLKERTSEKYESCISKIASKYDFRTMRIKDMLSGFEHRFEEIECQRIRERIAIIDSEITNLNDRIGSQYNDRNNCCIRLLGLEQKIAQADESSEIMEYFLCNPKLYLDRVTNSEMTFCVADRMSYFDKDMAERILENRNSYVYAAGGGSISGEKMAKLIRAIFIDEILNIKFCAAYNFDLNGNVRALSGFAFPEEYANFMPNTHINQFSCMGGYERTINTLLRDNNYIGAIEQCIASCKSLNWGDSTVMDRFMRFLYANNRNWIELPDGRYVKPSVAIQWLEEQEAERIEPQEEEKAHE